ncbi:OLC1v1008694C1 [Oldenlandia corymbosa var. corymbosa]|uniref:OLC1v1008694C1 n=1 Tax=Oldenlandia corymbosa var. corymbosa TaxID=529605 RepID=A0AAV1DM53_OLDCO|nr:OLC1v1008694C1 [Oldenlandia corymbosa var. corymbosa]
MVRWIPPGPNSCILSSDGSSCINGAGYGFVIRGEGGTFVYEECGFLGDGDSFKSEVDEILFGLYRYELLKLLNVVVKTDNKVLLEALTKQICFPLSRLPWSEIPLGTGLPPFASLFNKPSTDKPQKGLLIKPVTFVNGTAILEYEDEEYERLIAPPSNEFDLPIEFLNPEVIFSMAMIGKRGKNHEQLFTYEHVPAYCSKCSKIGHKVDDCKKRLAKISMEINKLKPVSKEVLQKAILKKQKNPNLGLKSMEAKGKASSSGLSEKEKVAFPVDVQDSPMKSAHVETESWILTESQVAIAAADSWVATKSLVTTDARANVLMTNVAANVIDLETEKVTMEVETQMKTGKEAEVLVATMTEVLVVTEGAKITTEAGGAMLTTDAAALVSNFVENHFVLLESHDDEEEELVHQEDPLPQVEQILLQSVAVEVGNPTLVVDVPTMPQKDWCWEMMIMVACLKGMLMTLIPVRKIQRKG